MQRGSLINSQAKMVGSFRYSTPVMVFFLVSTVWKREIDCDEKHLIDWAEEKNAFMTCISNRSS